jgi:hypothetical protein
LAGFFYRLVLYLEWCFFTQQAVSKRVAAKAAARALDDFFNGPVSGYAFIHI